MAAVTTATSQHALRTDALKPVTIYLDDDKENILPVELTSTSKTGKTFGAQAQTLQPPRRTPLGEIQTNVNASQTAPSQLPAQMATSSAVKSVRIPIFETLDLLMLKPWAYYSRLPIREPRNARSSSRCDDCIIRLDVNTRVHFVDISPFYREFFLLY
jgi:hypothetical protein